MKMGGKRAWKGHVSRDAMLTCKTWSRTLNQSSLLPHIDFIFHMSIWETFSNVNMYINTTTV